ncbi:NAD(P)/FAD-dependent oxidoreductase [Streptomyces sp. NPDC058690]|uniref:NAD(P)/FAD-dependent oxidoreductase n=1 Tax=Streptomyces sp. NPDC058690 TaxID=3346600 RepID=UPI003665D4F9
MYDVIVVGARAAGSPTAMLFARAGYRVLLLDRIRHPRDTLSTLYIHQPGVAHLNRWGVLDAVAATGCPPLDHARHQVKDVVLEGCSWPADGVTAAYAPRRYLLDRILTDEAVASGAEFREQSTVDELVFEEDRVVGVRYRSGRRQFEERARLVVGADGMRSKVAELAGARTELEDPMLTCAYYSFWSGIDTGFEVYESTRKWAGFVPTNDGLTLVGTYFPMADYDRVRADARTAYLENISAITPALADRMAGATQEDRLFGTGDQRNFFRQAAGPGWALVGDAGHHKDSLTGKGITDAFRQATALVESVGDGLRDEPRLDKSLRRYGERRDDLVMDGYRDTLAAAELRPGRRLPLMRAIVDDSQMTARFFSTISGVLPSNELMTPELRERVGV